VSIGALSLTTETSFKIRKKKKKRKNIMPWMFVVFLWVCMISYPWLGSLIFVLSGIVMWFAPPRVLLALQIFLVLGTIYTTQTYRGSGGIQTFIDLAHHISRLDNQIQETYTQYKDAGTEYYDHYGRWYEDIRKWSEEWTNNGTLDVTIENVERFYSFVIREICSTDQVDGDTSCIAKNLQMYVEKTYQQFAEDVQSFYEGKGLIVYVDEPHSVNVFGFKPNVPITVLWTIIATLLNSIFFGCYLYRFRRIEEKHDENEVQYEPLDAGNPTEPAPGVPTIAHTVHYYTN
jgi:hypothetical protein